MLGEIFLQPLREIRQPFDSPYVLDRHGNGFVLANNDESLSPHYACVEEIPLKECVSVTGAIQPPSHQAPFLLSETA